MTRRLYGRSMDLDYIPSPDSDIYGHMQYAYIHICTRALEKTYIIKIVEIISEMCYLTLIENCS